MHSTLIRLRYEKTVFNKDPIEGIRIEYPDESDLNNQVAYIDGPDDTPFQHGVYKLLIRVPTEYPYVAPSIHFATRLMHPNIEGTNGNICVDILKSKWAPALRIAQVLLSIRTLLADPNPDDPLDPTVAKLYRTDRDEYNKKVKKMTWDYAVPEDKKSDPDILKYFDDVISKPKKSVKKIMKEVEEDEDTEQPLHVDDIDSDDDIEGFAHIMAQSEVLGGDGGRL